MGVRGLTDNSGMNVHPPGARECESIKPIVEGPGNNSNELSNPKTIGVMKTNTPRDAIKAIRRGSRDAEKEILGPGFHTISRTHRSAKDYSRKQKHKKNYPF